MRCSAYPWLLTSVVLIGGCERELPPVAEVPQAARDVSQPDGWADDLALPVPEDLNPDPNVLEFNLEARIENLEFIAGFKTPA